MSRDKSCLVMLSHAALSCYFCNLSTTKGVGFSFLNALTPDQKPPVLGAS